MPQIDNILYRANVKVTAGWDAGAVCSDGLLDLKVTLPRELRGVNGRDRAYPQTLPTSL
jgi:hypothetical protein